MTASIKKAVYQLTKMNACEEAIVWLNTQTSAQKAWDNCKRGDWMLWLLGKLSGKPESDGRKKLVLAACGCARLSLKYVPKGEDRPRLAIETAEKWAHGKATIEEVRKAAADAAYATSYATSYAAAYTYAAYAAAYAADAETYADEAAYATAYATAYAADTAAYAADARSKTLSKCSDIVRKHYPKAPRLGGKK